MRLSPSGIEETIQRGHAEKKESNINRLSRQKATIDLEVHQSKALEVDRLKDNIFLGSSVTAEISTGRVNGHTM